MKQKLHSTINVLGLAIGVAACIIVGLFLYQELNFESSQKNRDQVFRIVQIDEDEFRAQTPGLLGVEMRDKFPEVSHLLRLHTSWGDLVRYKDVALYADDVIFASGNFFDMFTYNVILGDVSNFMRTEDTAVITRSFAQKYFGDENPLGKTMTLNNNLEITITGLIEDTPKNSHLQFGLAVNYQSLYKTNVGEYIEQWGAIFNSYTYAMVKPNSDIELLNRKLSKEYSQVNPRDDKVERNLKLQPIKDIHLRSNIEGKLLANGSAQYLIILSIVSIFILLLASINFINLTTAKAVKRAKEIGVRKVFGAFRIQLIRQFLTESMMISTMSLIISFILIELAKPQLVSLMENDFLNNLYNPISVLTIILFVLVLGVFAGIYPAFVLSSFKPISALKTKSLYSGNDKKSILLRRGLVVFQFCVAILLVIGTITINKQIRFMRNYDIGFDKEQIVKIGTPDRLYKHELALKDELKKIKGVESYSTCLGVPMGGYGFGLSMFTDEEAGENFYINTRFMDENYFDLFGLQLIAGENLSKFSNTEEPQNIIINETTVKKLGFSSPEEAIGKSYKISLNDLRPTIVGVVKDVPVGSLKSKISPVVYTKWNIMYREYAVKINTHAIDETIDQLEKVWHKFYPDYPFEFSFLDIEIDNKYKSERRLFKFITIFSSLAIFIAALGLIGLTTYTVEQRKKEVGIRKILGSTVGEIITLMTSEFVILISIANAISWIVGYFLLDKWLSDFAYRISVSFDIFILSAVVSLLVAILSTGFIVWRSANSNPVECLKYE
jgi:putative ABC transport system permease protein